VNQRNPRTESADPERDLLVSPEGPDRREGETRRYGDKILGTDRRIGMCSRPFDE